MVDLDAHLILSPHEPITQKASRSVEPFLQGSRVWQTDRQTDHATRFVTIGRIYVRSTVMRPNNIKHDNAHGHVSMKESLRELIL